jgi:ectoine hydroxylase-related dioxygenase (phytanoyl-CoA dioxygenase family)
VPAKSRIFSEEVLVTPSLLGIADSVLLPSCATYQLNLAHVLDRGPGTEQQIMHKDELVWNYLPKPHPQVQLAAIIALVDFTEMRAGSAVVYLGSTLHGGGANTTADEWRRGMHMSFVVGWLRTEENNYLSLWPDVIRTLPRRSQELLGFGAHDAIGVGGGYLGMVELQDPVVLLGDGRL